MASPLETLMGAGPLTPTKVGCILPTWRDPLLPLTCSLARVEQPKA